MTLKELENNIVEKLESIGVSKNFKNNPSYSSYVASIISPMIQQGTEIYDNENSIFVNQENNKLKVEYADQSGKRYHYDISCNAPDSILFTSVVEEPTVIDEKGTPFKSKSTVYKKANLDSNGEMEVIIDNIGMSTVDNMPNSSYFSTKSEKRVYESSGIMKTREIKIQHEKVLGVPYDSKAPNNIETYSNYDVREFLTREKFDTARYVIDDKSENKKYNSTVLLSDRYGLANLSVSEYFDETADIAISPLTPEEIEAKIQKESNPKVQEALRNLATGRENYYYDSTQDPNFIREGYEQAKSL